MRVISILFLSLITLQSLAKEKVELPWSALPNEARAPKDNPTTPAKVELGKKLYFDPRLSKDGTLSCNSCHNVMGNGTDNRAFSVGVGGKLGGRSSPTVWNSAFHSVQFWDGRAPSLEEQAKGPLTNPVEMAMENHDAVMARVKSIPGYTPEFEKVFGKNSVNIDNLAKAIAAFERTLIAKSAFDRYANGDKKALSAQAVRGMNTVIEVGCIACHSGKNFNGPELEMGQGFYQKFPTFEDNEYVKKYDLLKDEGRFQVTKAEEDKHMFRVPTWRNVAFTAPYFHNGSVKTLDEAVRVMAKVQLNKELTNDQVADIVAFLNSLNGEFPKIAMPRLPETPGITLLH